MLFDRILAAVLLIFCGDFNIPDYLDTVFGLSYFYTSSPTIHGIPESFNFPKLHLVEQYEQLT